jgi:hypothetical protein
MLKKAIANPHIKPLTCHVVIAGLSMKTQGLAASQSPISNSATRGHMSRSRHQGRFRGIV